MACSVAARNLQSLRVGASRSLLNKHFKGAVRSLIQRRCILSAAFRCDDVWGRIVREDPVLLKQNSEFLVSQLFSQFEKVNAATAVDMEVFAAKIDEVDPSQMDVVENLFKRFRTCPQGVSVIDSMSHNLIRNYLKLNQSDRLVPIIQQKMKFGIFPDNHAFCLLMDHFIKSKNYTDAVNMAIEMMLQEDISHTTARLLALHACSTHLDQDKANLLSAFTEDDKTVLDTEEEEYIVVQWQPLFNFDNHFQITDRKRLIGRTLALMSKYDSDPVYTSYRYIGLAMEENFKVLFAELENRDTGAIFHREVLDTLSQCLEASKFKTETIVREDGYQLKQDSEYNFRCTLEEKQEYIQRYQELRPQLESLSLLETNLLEDTNQLVTRGLSERLDTAISEYTAQLEDWSVKRQHNVSLQERAFSLKQRKEAFDTKIAELTEKEELLNYFVRQNEISIALLKANKAQGEVGEVDHTEYIAEPGKRGKSTN